MKIKISKKDKKEFWKTMVKDMTFVSFCQKCGGWIVIKASKNMQET